MKNLIHESIPSTKKLNLHKRGLIIAGPCSAETEEQLMETAKAIALSGTADVFRAGIWKPRTNPGCFEGIGKRALAWLLNVKQETGLPVAVEVATPNHVEDSLSFDVDLIWIGARTTVNPFAMQELADSLRGTNIPVLVKNPVNPDLKLWLGAVERLQKANSNQIGLIHRGFSSYGEKKYRNAPLWQIPIEMKRLLPELPIICDPSHICGNRNNLKQVAQQSLDLNYDGLMIETHWKPEDALTDKQQQITPEELLRLLKSLQQKQNQIFVPEHQRALESLRSMIDAVDSELIHLLASRMQIAQEIGDLKRKEQTTVLQPSRYQEIVHKALLAGKEKGLSESFICTYMEAVHIESIRIQNEIPEPVLTN
jgi:chorismate mutase